MPLSLNDIVNVVVSLSPVAAVRSGFNLGLIIGDSDVIPKADRVRTYTSTDAMIDDGFDLTDPEVIAAQLYFNANGRSKPTRVAIGVWDSTGAETALEAVQACRAANSDWYGFTVLDALKADIQDVAAYTESAKPASAYFYTTADADVLAGTAGNIMETLKGLKYRRTLGQYSKTNYAVASILGYAMGANTGLINSAYTLAYKSEVGVATEDLTDSQVTDIKGVNGNVYINRGATYDVFEQGVMADGTPFDEIINLDMLSNNIQLAVMDLLTGYPKIPQTEDGVSLLINAINRPCSNARNIGFIAPGVWNAPSILDLSTGDMLSAGYLIMAESVASQSQADREARKAPPIYVCIKLAGAIEHVVINVQVNR